MPESLDLFRYIGYLRLRWVWIAGSCAVAVALALGVSLLLPRQYTATARIVIEPPAGSDPRSAMALTPIYLESLKTYEEFAAGDSLFEKMADRFHLRAAGQPIESLKKHVLKVGLVRNTRILEIAATLPDPHRAQQLAQALAESTVDLSRTLATQGDDDQIASLTRQENDVRAEVDSLETAWSHLMADEPVLELESGLAKSAELRASLNQQLLSTEQEIADAAQRQKAAGASEAAEAGRESANAAARLEEIRRQVQALDADTKERERLLAARMSHRDKLDSQRKAAESSLATLDARLHEERADSGSRGEQLRVIDPGVVPERPSAPNLPLNLMAALLLGLVLPMVYLALELNYREAGVTARREVYRQGGR